MQPDKIALADMTLALGQMGYTIVIEGADDFQGLVFYRHPDIPTGYLLFDFRNGSIEWDIIESSLEQEGINVDAFCAYLQ